MEKDKKSIYKKWWFWLIIIIIIFVIIGSQESGNNTTKDATYNIQVSSQASEDDNVPVEYKNALIKAQTYSDTMHMSKTGLFEQLTSEYGEQFPTEAAQYAIDNVKADWKQNALEKAKTYQSTMNMSKKSIYEQLVSEYGEQFTAEEAQYAIDNLAK